MTEGAAAERMAPHNPEAERTVLGAILLDNAALASAVLQPGDFYAEAHKRIFAALRTLADRGAAVDTVTLGEELGRAGQLEAVGGSSYLGSLVDGMPRLTNVAQWAAIVRQHAQRRRLVRVAEQLAEAALAGQDTVAQLIERADAALLRIGSRDSEGRGPLDNKQLVDAALDNIHHRMTAPGGIIGYRTGLRELDRILQGIRPGRMGIIASRLGNGKSMLAMNLAEAIAAQEPDRAVLFFSLEMDGVELMERRLSAAAKVNPNTLHSASDERRAQRWARLFRSGGELQASRLRVIEDAWTVTEIAQHCREVRNAEGLAAVCVDYVQLMRSERARAQQRRHEEVAEISVNLRKLAKDLNVPLVVVAQLNREAAGRDGKPRKPTMEGLAESDNLGRDAHWCVMIDPDEVDRGKADLYVRKNRGGIKGKARVEFRGSISCFRDLDEEQTQGGPTLWDKAEAPKQ